MTKKLRFYLFLLAIAAIILYLAPYFYPLIKNWVKPIEKSVSGVVVDQGLNPKAVIILTALLATFLFVLVVTTLVGGELEKHIKDLLSHLRHQ